MRKHYGRISTGTAILLLILALALALRVWGASFGLPFVYHEDEGLEVNRALQLGTGEFDYSFFRMLKGGYFYLLFAEYGVLFVVLKLIGSVQSVQDFALLYVRDPSVFYMVGRVTTAAIGTLSVFLLYRISARICSPRVGVIAALLLAVNALHVVQSHYITVDIPLSCLALACLLFIARIEETGHPRDYFWAGIFLGLATITKLPGIVLIVPLALVHFRRSFKEDGFSLRAFFDMKVVLVGVVFCVVFFLTNFGALLHFQRFLENVVGLFSSRLGTSDRTAEAPFQHVYYLRALHESIGSALLCFALLGACVVAWKRHYISLIFLIFWVCFFVVISLPADHFLVYKRYLLPLIAVTLLFAAIGIDWISHKIAETVNRPSGVTVAGLLTLILAIVPLRGSIAADMQFLAKDTRTITRDWFEENVPQGASILIEGHTAKSLNEGVQLRNSIENLQSAIREFELRGENGKVRYFNLELMIGSESGKRFDLHFYSFYNLNRWSDYAERDFDYVVVRSSVLTGSAKYGPAGKQFLAMLRSDPNYCVVAAFEGYEDSVNNEDGEGRDVRGPTVEVYGQEDMGRCLAPDRQTRAPKNSRNPEGHSS